MPILKNVNNRAELNAKTSKHCVHFELNTEYGLDKSESCRYYCKKKPFRKVHIAKLWRMKKLLIFYLWPFSTGKACQIWCTPAFYPSRVRKIKICKELLSPRYRILAKWFPRIDPIYKPFFKKFFIRLIFT